jgi:hypothetical protein
VDFDRRQTPRTEDSLILCLPLLLLVAVCAGGAHAQDKVAEADGIRLHVVPTPVKSYRLLSMSMDDDGFIWAGAIHRVLHRYDPRTGEVETIPLPFDAVVCSCICFGDKVYVLGQSYPRLIIYNRKSKQFTEAAYPSAKPDVWYGTPPIDGRYLFLFDRATVGVIRWDTKTDRGEVMAWPYPTAVPPSSGWYEPLDNAVWCQVFDFAGGQYVPLGVARLDVAIPENTRFTGYYPYPADDTGLEPFANSEATFFVPLTLKGKLIPFDFKARRWCRFVEVPEFGRRFGFIGLGTRHDGRWYFSLSTYNGTETGSDGKPYHFCNALLEFDPRRGTFAFPTLEAEGAYHQVAYTLSAGGEFFATGTNIREADGRLDQARQGEVVFWQTVKPTPR